MSSAQGPALEREIEALRVRLAGEPGDPGLNLALARALDQAGRPGGAIRHYQNVLRHRRLDVVDRRALARLYLDRAGARLALGDGDALGDLDRAKGQGGAPEARLAREALFAGALAALRRADRPGRARAAELLARAARLAPGDPRLAASDPERAGMSALAGAAAWLADGGARRAALDLYAVYAVRGGRAPEHATRYLVLHRWWYGDRERPSGLLLHQLAGAGVDLCAVARDLDDLGCGAALVARTAGDVQAVRLRATRLGWRTSDPVVAARWVEVALEAWLAGEIGSWTEELRARVDLVALEKSQAVPAHAAATLWRAAGRAGRAAAALDRVAARAVDLTPEERGVVVAEAADAGRSDDLVDRLLASGATLDPAWRAALRAARRSAPGGPREAALLDRAPPTVAAQHLRDAGELGALAAREPSPAARAALARWRAALADQRLRAGRDAALARWRPLAGGAAIPEDDRPLPIGTVDPHRITGDREEAAALARIARSYLRSPAAAERLAGDFADGAPALGQRGPLVAELFLRLGDPARAWGWAERVSRSSPDHARYLMAAGAVSVAAGAVDRADVFFIRGAQASGDAGAASLAAVRRFLAHGHPLPAVAAARRAVQLTAPGQPEHDEATRLAAFALDQLGRSEAARRLRGDQRAAVADQPASPIDFPPVDSAAWQQAIADRLARALLAPPDQAAALFTVLADELDRANLPALAAALRREASSVSADF